MARLNTDIPIQELRKVTGKLVVVKQYGEKLVITQYPDMSKIRASEKQKDMRNKFRQAVNYAKGILQDPAKRKLYSKKVKAPQTLYHFLLQEYLK